MKTAVALFLTAYPCSIITMVILGRVQRQWQYWAIISMWGGQSLYGVMEEMLACCQTAEAGHWRWSGYKPEPGFVKVLDVRWLIKVNDQNHYVLKFLSVILGQEMSLINSRLGGAWSGWGWWGNMSVSIFALLLMVRAAFTASAQTLLIPHMLPPAPQ